MLSDGRRGSFRKVEKGDGILSSGPLEMEIRELEQARLSKRRVYALYLLSDEASEGRNLFSSNRDSNQALSSWSGVSLWEARRPVLGMGDSALFVGARGVGGESENDIHHRLGMSEGGVAQVEGPVGGPGGGRARRRALLVGAFLSGVVLVLSLVTLTLSGGGGAVELAGKYNYGRYGGLAPEDRHERQVREDPHGLVYYNVFTDKAVRPHRWLSQSNFREVIKKMMALVTKMTGESVGSQEGINNGFLKATKDMTSKVAQFKVDAKSARTAAENELRDTIMTGVKTAEKEGFAELDKHKAKITADLEKRATQLNVLLAAAEKAASSRIAQLRVGIASNTKKADAQFAAKGNDLDNMEKGLANYNDETSNRLNTMESSFDGGIKAFDEARANLAKDLLDTKIMLATQVDSQMDELKVRMTTLIVEMRLVIVRLLKESHDRTRGRLGEPPPPPLPAASVFHEEFPSR